MVTKRSKKVSGEVSEIITSTVSVYEVILDLKDWENIDSIDVPGFEENLAKTIPSLQKHKCMTGKEGGFLSEVRKGTNFAHVIEHVLLELIHLTDASGKIYNGWTRKKDGQVYVIHYGAPDFLTGRLSAILGVDLVKKLIAGEKVELDHYLRILRDPISYFVQDDVTPASLYGLVEPCSTIVDAEGISAVSMEFSPEESKRVTGILCRVSDRLPRVDDLWREAFFKYGGDFGRSIVDKMELLNVDKFMELVSRGAYDLLFNGVRNVSHVICSYRIPLNFMVHSIWLYKNILMDAVISEHEKHSGESLRQITLDLERFFQILLVNVSEGSKRRPATEELNRLDEFQEFRELDALLSDERLQKSILIVDDDEMTRNVLRDMLVHEGYRVLLAGGGRAGLEMFGMSGGKVSLVILDLLKPDMGGMEVYREIKRTSPETRVLIASGIPLESPDRELLEKQEDSFIAKPFKREDLLMRVHGVLRMETA